MAAQTCIHTQHATLSGTTADTVTFTGNGSAMAVTNRAGAVPLYFRMDGTAAVSAADETYVVMPGTTKVLEGHWGRPVVSIVGSGNDYSVELF